MNSHSIDQLNRAAIEKSSTINSQENSMSEEIEDIRELSDGEKVRLHLANLDLKNGQISLKVI